MPLIKNIFANTAWTLLRSPANPPTHASQPLCSYWSASTFTVYKKSPVFTIFKKAGHNSQKNSYEDFTGVGWECVFELAAFM